MPGRKRKSNQKKRKAADPALQGKKQRETLASAWLCVLQGEKRGMQKKKVGGDTFASRPRCKEEGKDDSVVT